MGNFNPWGEIRELRAKRKRLTQEFAAEYDRLMGTIRDLHQQLNTAEIKVNTLSDANTKLTAEVMELRKKVADIQPRDTKTGRMLPKVKV